MLSVTRPVPKNRLSVLMRLACFPRMLRNKPVWWKQLLRLLGKWFGDHATLLHVSIPRANFKCKLPLMGYKNQILGALRTKNLNCLPGHSEMTKKHGRHPKYSGIGSTTASSQTMNTFFSRVKTPYLLSVINVDNSPVHFCKELLTLSVGII